MPAIDVHVKTSTQTTTLMYACETYTGKPGEDIVNTLLQKKVDVNAKNTVSLCNTKQYLSQFPIFILSFFIY